MFKIFFGCDNIYSVSINGIDIIIETSPGLFSPNRADRGTLFMLGKASVGPGDTVLDLGCGAGLVGIYSALAGAERVVMSDIDPEAVRLARLNAERNGVPEVGAVISDGFDSIGCTGFTKILSNPPYHADFGVPRRFIEKGFNRLALGGSMFMVTKRLEWYKNKFISVFGGVRVHRCEDYFVFEAEKRSTQYACRR